VWNKEDMDKLLNEIREDLRKGVVKISESIRTVFERQKTNKTNDTLEGKQFRKDLHLLVDEARNILKGVVVESLERCKANR
jgi:tRNA A37 threonylcarbamoyladenosine dehydratase